jgi:membrane-bound metal-dependent hydrolase YbcI (DUF457 family)
MTATYAPARPRAARVARQTEEARYMDGSVHAATGLALGVGVSLLTLPAGHGGPYVAHAVSQTLAYGMLTGSLALLPDADHHDASFAHAAGPVSWTLAHVISALFGGHRQGMHSIFGVALVSVLTAWATLWAPNDHALTAVAVLLAVCAAAGLKATRFARGGLEAVAFGCAISGFAVWTVRADLWWLCALGMALHIAEDEFTGHGCALLWPLSRRRIGGDGGQPAASRQGEYKRRQAAQPGTARPKSPRPVGARRPKRAPGGLPLPAMPDGRMTWVTGARCGECLTKAHRECTDRGCQCTSGQHPSRPGAKPAPAPAVPVDDDETPPF